MTGVRLLDRGQGRDDCQDRHQFLHGATEHQSCRHGNGAAQQMEIAAFPAAVPIEFAAVQFIRAGAGQVTPQRAERPGDQFFTGDNASQPMEAEKDAGNAEQHSDDRADSDEAFPR